MLKWISVWMVFFTAGVVCALFGLPQLHEETILASKEYTGDIEALLQWQDIDFQKPEAVVGDDETGKTSLMIELPQGIVAEDVTIENDYMAQRVLVHIPSDSKDYFSDYKIKGSSNHIEGIDYYHENGDGVIALGLDTVCEVQKSYADEMLCLNFAEPHEIYDKVVVVDAGHGGRDSGASKLGINEKDINLAILLEVQRIFDESDENIGVYYTRTEDANPSLEQRAALANEVGADLFISIHSNSTRGGFMSNTNGTVVMYSESDDSERSSMRLAEICLDEVTGTLDSKRVGLLKGDKIYIIRSSEVPVALVEVGFMTNREELANLNDPEYQKQAAQGIYNAIVRAFEEGY